MLRTSLISRSFVTGLGAICAMTTLTHAAAIAVYDFTGETAPTGQIGSLNATSADANTTASPLTITPFPFVSGNASMILNTAVPFGGPAPYLSVFPGAGANSGPTATALDQYIGFTVSAAPGFELDLTTLTFSATRGGGSSPRGFVLQTSVGGFSTDGSTNVATVELPTSGATNSPQSYDFSGPSFQDLSSLSVRLYIFAPATGNSVNFDDFSLNGSVVSVPEPSALAAIGVLAGIPAFARRRRAR